MEKPARDSISKASKVNKVSSSKETEQSKKEVKENKKRLTYYVRVLNLTQMTYYVILK